MAKGYVPNQFEEVFVIKNVKNTVAWTYVCSDLKGENLLERFIKKNCKRPIKENLGQKKQLREKVIRYMSNGGVIMIILPTVVLIKRNC